MNLLVLPFKRKQCKGALGASAALFVLLSLTQGAFAGDREVGLSLSQAGVWDTNPLMRVDQVEELYGSTTTLRLNYADKTPATSFGFGAWVNENLFDQSDFNSTDFHATTGLAHKGERFDASLNAKADLDTTRESEFTEIGLATKMVQRTGYSLAPQMSYSLSSISKLGLTSSYMTTVYDDDSYTDSHAFVVSPSYQRNFSELYSGVLTLRARRSETDSGPQKITDSIGPTLGITAKITERLRAQAHAGQEASREETEGVVTRDWTWNNVFSSSLTFDGEQDKLSLSASRSQQAYANGSDRLLTTISMQQRHNVNPALSLNIGANYRFSDLADDASGQLDRAYGGDAGLVYHATQKVDLSTSYRYRNELLTGSSKAVQQNVVRLGLTYRHNMDLVSR